MSDHALQLSIVVSPATPFDAPFIERLDERAFGPGRFSRTAYRLREGHDERGVLSFVAHVSTLLVGANRLTPIRCGATPALLLGPLTVDPAFRSRGVARVLVGDGLAAARAAGHRLVILVGDEAYYSRYGFARVPSGRLQMPGPVDPARLLYLELEPGAFEGVSGPVKGV
jgi:predicted N-acetyltransferase YhbS